MKCSDNVLLILLVLVALIPLTGCTSTTLEQNATANASRAAALNDPVTVDYVGSFTNGTVFDTSNATAAEAAGILRPGRDYAPLPVTIGEHNVIPGFENALVGMKVGESKRVTIPPEDAYGTYNESYVVPFPIDRLIENNVTVEIGRSVTLATAHGKIPTVIRSIDTANNTVNLDYNSPMAGKTLVFDLKLCSIE